ncbi:MAG: YkvA family protein [Sulfurimonas sp.]|nr:YkvA family protein [Sulfurimonas sp.]
MNLTKEQLEKAKKQFEEDIKNVDEDDVQYASKKGTTKINGMENSIPSVLLKMWDDIKLMIELLTDYIKGNYKEVPWNIIAAITGAIIYFVSPIDVIPDFIPVVGYLDDAAVIKLALNFSQDDLNKYAKWKNI